MRSLLFLLREAAINLRRHGLMSLATITTMAIALTLLGTYTVTFFQLRTLSTRTIDAFEMRVFCRPDLTLAALQETETKLKALAGVAQVTYRSKAEAFADATKSMPIDTTGLPNLMPDTFVVKLKAAEKATPVATTIRTWTETVEQVELPEDELKVMLQLARFLQLLGLVGGGLQLFGALVVVVNTIRLSVFARRREIKIMQIIGATPWFIRLPMVFEGLIHGIVGGALAFVAQLVLIRYTDSLLLQIPLLASYLSPTPLAPLAAGLLLGGGLLGAGGALFSVHRYLR